MLLSSSKDQPKISERDLILANALAYVESIEQKIAERKLAAAASVAASNILKEQSHNGDSSKN